LLSAAATLDYTEENFISSHMQLHCILDSDSPIAIIDRCKQLDHCSKNNGCMGKWKFRTIQQVISAVVVVASTYTRKYDKKKPVAGMQTLVSFVGAVEH
jgi:hypothetical protein